MNITLIIVILIMIMMMIRGYKKGLTKEITGLVSLIVTLFVISIVITLYMSLHLEETKNAVASIVILVVIAFIYSIIKIFMKSAKILSKLPVINIVDKVLGIIIGGAKGLIIVWLLYILNEAGFLGELSGIIMRDTLSSEILLKIVEYNYLLKMVSYF